MLKFGGEKLILGADYKDKKIATNGWLESSDLNVLEFIASYEKQGLQYTVCTDIDKDGMLNGPSIELYKEIIGQSKIKLIASGGVTSMKDLIELKTIGCEAAIIGKAIYEGHITLKELRQLC